MVLCPRISKERSDLVVSHRRPAFINADHIILLKDGAIECQGSLERVMEESRAMQDIWQNMQVVDNK